MSIITELATRLTSLAPPATPLSGAYVAYLATLALEVAAGGTLSMLLGLRLVRGLARAAGRISFSPEHLLKLVIPLACLVICVSFVAMDIR